MSLRTSDATTGRRRGSAVGGAVVVEGLGGEQAQSRNAYKDVRALTRGLAIVEALAALGWVKPGVLSTHTGIDRTTVYRLVNTLIESGYVVRRAEDSAVGLSRRLVTLGQNVRVNDLASEIVLPHLSRLTQAIKWPSDFGVLSEGALRIAASTHGESPMSMHRAMIGHTRPMFRSALGKAYLAALPEAELAEVIALARLRQGADSLDAQAQDSIRRSLADVRARGFAHAVGTTEAKFSAIALPVRRAGAVLGAVNIIFLRSALTVEQAADRYLDRLREAVSGIEHDLSNR